MIRDPGWSGTSAPTKGASTCPVCAGWSRSHPAQEPILSSPSPSGSAADKTGGIQVGEATEKSLQNKLSEHNKKMDDDGRPDWTKTTMGAFCKVGAKSRSQEQ